MALPFVSESVYVLAGVSAWSRGCGYRGTARGRSDRVCEKIGEGWSWLWALAAVRTLAITISTFNVTFGADWTVLAGSASSAAIWRSLLHIAHADEHTRATAPIRSGRSA